MNKTLFSWVDVNGQEYSLNNSQYTLLVGTVGFYMPPISFTDEDIPFRPGGRLRTINVGARELDVPLKISGVNEIDFLKSMRNLLRIFNPLKGDGKFLITAIDGSKRELSCRYIGGFEMDESYDSRGRNWQKAIGVFKAFDPFWYDMNTIVESFTTGQPATFFPFFPLRLSSSSVFADTTVDNVGDVEAYPEWIVTGPGENIVLRNLTTGEVTNINYSLGVGESITVDTKPYVKTVTKNDGTNLFYTLSDGSSLWALQDGQNSIRLEMSNATVESGIQLSYKNRYWGP